MRRMLFSLLLQLEVFSIASAAKFLLPPIATRAEDGAIARTQQPQPTTAPEYFVSTELLKRDGYTMGHDTCGFGSLNTAATYQCYSSVGTCENIGSYRGCCTGGLKACSSTFWTQCDDYDSMGSCGLKTRCCGSIAPYCISWLFSTSGSTLTAFDCDYQSMTRTFELLATPLSLLDSTTSTTDNSDTSLSSTSSTQDGTSSPSTTGGSTSTVSGSSATTSASETPELASSNGSSSTPVGAIVGGVVGGVAVIGLIVLGVLFIRKYQRGASNATSPPPAPSGPQELPGAGVYSNTSQGYEGHAAQFAVSGKPKTEMPMAHTSPIVEAPTTPATGTNHNRAELAGCVEVHRYEIYSARRNNS
ncbi:uncharacterized protein F4822DRAFT_274488 [Hypoxylon trugodes]|uniref:uncharacterized protein n=1 Tax=Hypoxylon trugodes TaxID=326681 RepID=UPI00218ED52D|nr:uncharacterized protein F4822DRAFT_274488 [Hypoxylon trugodes]KAI1387119.1 hypothetical protein F4822DRAFT_274488 [Hypoxylon trugodes]